MSNIQFWMSNFQRFDVGFNLLKDAEKTQKGCWKIWELGFGKDLAGK